MARYSLWEEPWIPVVRLSGEPDRLSLRDALVDAHHVREVFDPSPLVTVAIHRLLLAVLYRVYRPETSSDWAELWKAERFAPDQLDGYGAFWNDRFDLLHPQRPFYQVPLIADEKIHPISALVMEAAAGKNPTLFDHGRVEGADSLPLDRAACHLLAHQLFAPSGGNSKPFYRSDSLLTKGAVVEAIGRSLYETLLLNLIPTDQWGNHVPPTNEDCPFWEIDEPAEPVQEGTIPLGPMHYLTLQSRQIHLEIDAIHGLVTGVQIRQRYVLPKTSTRVDPAKAYIRSEERGWSPFRLTKQRAAWQHADVLLQAADADRARPLVMDWLAYVEVRLRSRFGLDISPSIGCSVTGLCTAQEPGKAAKVELWRRERLPLPMALLERRDLVAELEEMLLEARRGELLIKRTAQALVWATADRQAIGEAVSFIWTGKVARGKKLDSYKGLAQSLGMVTRYWPALEGPFRHAVEDLPEQPVAVVREAWREAIQAAARDSFKIGRDSLLQTEASFEVLSRIGSAFHGKLFKFFTEAGEEGSENDEGTNE